jgi:hypothetical protein
MTVISDRLRNRNLRFVAVAVFGALLLLCLGLDANRLTATAIQRRVARVATTKKPRTDYTNFSHETHVAQQKLACDSCHKFPTGNWKEVRKGEAAFPDVAEFPEHAACLNCHRQQFFARERPAPLICSNCHVASSPRDTTRFEFPSLGDVADPAKKRRDVVSEFVVSFPHDKHMDVIGTNGPVPGRGRSPGFVNAAFQQEKPKEESDPRLCVICHKTYQPQGDSAEEHVTKPPKNIGDAFWLKKGTFKTIPVSHAQCSSCHNTEAGIEPAPSQCDACHKLSPPQQETVDFDPKLPAAMGITDRMILSRWQQRESSATFPHEGGLHPTLSCTTCHNVPTMNTADAKSLKVPVKSCGGAEGCHVTAMADDGGALNYEIDQRKAKTDFQCTKCHLTFGEQALPTSHLEALPKPVAK